MKTARRCIELCVETPEFKREDILKELKDFNRRQGLFVTIRYMPTMALRGHMGLPTATSTVGESLVEAAAAAACDDPSFVPISKNELDDIVIEIAILSKPLFVKGGDERIKEIAIGRDGVMARYGIRQGLILPSEAVERGFDAKGLLEEACRRVGIPGSHWSQPNVNIFKFETQVFREEAPNGKIIEGSL